MDLSWATIILIPTIITPALLLYFFFRLNVPKSKAPPQNDFISILLFSLLAVLVNIQLLAYLANIILRAYFSDGTKTSNIFELYRSLIGRNDYNPLRPFIYFYSFFNDFLETNVLGIFIDLHLRPLLLVAGSFCLFRIISLIKSPIDRKYHNNQFVKMLNAGLAKSSEPFKKYFFSYWNYVLDFNENLEILMIDVLNEDENLYSGRFVDWTPDSSPSSDTIGSIGMQNVFKYGPLEKNPNIPINNPGHFTIQQSIRNWKQIKNAGTMYIPYDRAKTIHIWKIIRGSTLNIWVDDPSSNEKMKWYLQLVGKKLNFIEKIEIMVNVKSQIEKDNYQENFENFLIEHELEGLLKIIDLNIFVDLSNP